MALAELLGEIVMVTAGMTVGRAVLFMVDEAIAVIAAVLFNDDGIDAVTKPEVLGDPDILALASTVRCQGRQFPDVQKRGCTHCLGRQYWCGGCCQSGDDGRRYHKATASTA